MRDRFVWITGDALCSPIGPCKAPAARVRRRGRPSRLRIQGLKEGAFGELAPAQAYAEIKPGSSAYATGSVGLEQSYLIDTDLNVEPQGALIYEELTRNDATKIGDIAVFEVCEVAQPAGFVPVMAPPPVLIYEVGHDPDASHARWYSHRTQYSHYRYGSHWPVMSHNRWGSHWPQGSFGHWPPGSYSHWPPGSYGHYPKGSVSHWPPGSVKHWPPGVSRIGPQARSSTSRRGRSSMSRPGRSNRTSRPGPWATSRRARSSTSRQGPWFTSRPGR
jgi:hypothetical protein